MSESQEKDNFWLYVVIGVVVFAGAIFMVKKTESGKYETAAKAIAEDASNSAYKHKP
jgi:hypothetical protein